MTPFVNRFFQVKPRDAHGVRIRLPAVFKLFHTCREATAS